MIKNFYNDVEKKGFLKNVLYSDSVAEYNEILVRRGTTTSVQTFDELWKELELEYPIQSIIDKQYIDLSNSDVLTLTYDVNSDKLYFAKPHYIMRHKINKTITRLNLTNASHLDITNDHSLLKYDLSSRKFKPIKPDKASYVPIIRNQVDFGNSINFENWKNVQPMKLKGTFFGAGTSRENPEITRKESRSFLQNIRALKIQSKELTHYDGYVYDISIPETQIFITNGVLVHNTDSVYVVIPVDDVDNMSIEERVEIAEKVAGEINRIIEKFLKEDLLPRSNIKPKHNQTFFKTELLIESIMFLDVKKQYAFLPLAEEGNIIKNRNIDYTGIQIVKSDAAKFTQDLLIDMIEKVVLNSDVKKKDRPAELLKVYNGFRQRFINACQNYDTNDIGFPGKWGKKDMFINGMKLYNHIMSKQIFTRGSAGKFVYCDLSKFRSDDIDISKTNGVVFPLEYDKDEAIRKLNEHNIQIDVKTQWNKLITTTCHRVITMAKM